MIEDIARLVFETAVEQAPHAEWEHYRVYPLKLERNSPFMR